LEARATKAAHGRPTTPRPHKNAVLAQLMARSSTSKMRSALGGITPPAPRAP